MAALQSDRDAILVAIPMVIVLFAAFFRLDELVCRNGKRSGTGRTLSGWDKNGRPVCLDPGSDPCSDRGLDSARTLFEISRRRCTRE
jgi:hypothetical protein